MTTNGNNTSEASQVDGIGAAWLRVSLSDTERGLERIKNERRDNLARTLLGFYGAKATARRLARDLTEAGFIVSEQDAAEFIERTESEQSY